MKCQKPFDFLVKVAQLLGSGFNFAINYVFDLVDKRQIIRRVTFMVTLFMTYKTWEWAINLVDPTTQQLGLLAAVNILLGGMFKFYNDSRENNQ